MGAASDRFPSRLRWFGLIGLVGLLYGLSASNWFLVAINTTLVGIVALVVLSGRAPRIPEDVMRHYWRTLLIRLLLVLPLGLVAWMGVLAVTGSAVAGVVSFLAILVGGHLAAVRWARRSRPGRA